MQETRHSIGKTMPGTGREVRSFRFGTAGKRPYAYVQAGLHATEQPGVLIARKLIARLAALEAEGRITGSVTVVPMANPIGLDQHILGLHQGRFDTATGDNFNRHFSDLAALLPESLGAGLGDDEAGNVAAIRTALGTAIAGIAPRSEAEALKTLLLGLAVEADIVLDMHCDSEAEVHLYAHSRQLADAILLGRHIGARAILHAELQSGDSFDEACMAPWGTLATRWPERPIPMACFGSTLEWRGVGDVDDAIAETDAGNVVAFLRGRGVVSGVAEEPPAPLCRPTPLAATDILRAPVAGTIVYRLPLGSDVSTGDVVADIVDPVGGDVTSLAAGCSGRFYARERRRFAVPDLEVAYIAGSEIRRSGNLLSR